MKKSYYGNGSNFEKQSSNKTIKLKARLAYSIDGIPLSRIKKIAPILKLATKSHDTNKILRYNIKIEEISKGIFAIFYYE